MHDCIGWPPSQPRHPIPSIVSPLKCDSDKHWFVCRPSDFQSAAGNRSTAWREAGSVRTSARFYTTVQNSVWCAYNEKTPHQNAIPTKKKIKPLMEHTILWERKPLSHLVSSMTSPMSFSSPQKGSFVPAVLAPRHVLFSQRYRRDGSKVAFRRPSLVIPLTKGALRHGKCDASLTLLSSWTE